MFLNLKMRWPVINAVKPLENCYIPPGRHEIERIPSPFGTKSFWIVLKGTTIGMTEEFWLHFSQTGIKNLDAIIEN